MDSENSENKQGSEKKELNLMPPALPAPPLEKETYIPPNQLELEWEMSPCSRVTTQEWDELMNSDSRNSLRQTIEEKNEKIKELKNTLEKIAAIISDYSPLGR